MIHQKPENKTDFYIMLTDVSLGARIDPTNNFARVTMDDSDYPIGFVEFHNESEFVLFQTFDIHL